MSALERMADDVDRELDWPRDFDLVGPLWDDEA